MPWTKTSGDAVTFCLLMAAIFIMPFWKKQENISIRRTFSLSLICRKPILYQCEAFKKSLEFWKPHNRSSIFSTFSGSLVVLCVRCSHEVLRDYAFCLRVLLFFPPLVVFICVVIHEATVRISEPLLCPPTPSHPITPVHFMSPEAIFFRFALKF